MLCIELYCVNYPCEIIKTKHPVTVIGDKKPIWIVGKSYVLHVPTKMLLSKDFLLMIKDIALARSLSQLSMMFRANLTQGHSTLVTLRTLYDDGDKLLSQFGNKAYKIIKLLESECTERWNILGQQHRPVIPLSTSLRNHLDATLLEYPEMGELATQFFLTVRGVEDPWIAAQMYGTFRHWGHLYIDYMAGLKKLHDRVTKQLNIDKKYAQDLGSDFCHLVMESLFKKHKKWFATSKGLPEKSALKQCIDDGVWPPPK